MPGRCRGGLPPLLFTEVGQDLGGVITREVVAIEVVAIEVVRALAGSIGAGRLGTDRDLAGGVGGHLRRVGSRRVGGLNERRSTPGLADGGVGRGPTPPRPGETGS